MRQSPGSLVRAIYRARTAITRLALSAPAQQATLDRVLRPERSVLDYGCGLGGDVDRLRRAGYRAWGWDPNHLPDGKREPADIVLLAFVLNVIDIIEERDSALINAFLLADLALVIGVRTTIRAKSKESYLDGYYIEQKSTFQKQFSDQQLVRYIDDVLGISCHIAGPGIAYVFKDRCAEREYLASAAMTGQATKSD